MSINTDSSAGKAVASRFGLNKKTKHIQTMHNPADVVTKRLPAATINSHLDRLCLQAQSPTTVNAFHGLPTSKRMTVGLIDLQSTSTNETRPVVTTA
eukprot:1095302-Amphidinium_carterae.1